MRVAPTKIRFKLSNDLDLGGVKDGDWDITRRVQFDRTEKYRSIVQRYVQGLPWLETEMFRRSYPARFKKGDRVRTARSLEALATQYEERADAMFESLKADGFLPEVDGSPVPLPKVHVARDGEIILGNQGNHRLAMAKILNLPLILARVHTVHARYAVD